MSRKNQDKHILVAMSGGVDSSVALYLLKEQGYTVYGATMKLWDYSDVGGQEHARADGGCCDLNAINNARTVCENLGIRHYVIDFSKEFKNTVIENFVTEYSKGRTPNPCVLCNTEIKWEMFLRYARGIGCDYIATGHYAITGFDESEQRNYLRRGIDCTRDQAYALWGISQEALARTFLPLGNLEKKEVRVIAEKAGLKTAKVAESMEICFIADNNYERFIRERTDKDIPPGDIIDEEGNILGRHRGVPFYTIGQRRGLGISNPTPLYVNKIDVGNNRVVVGNKKAVHSHEFTISQVNWVSKSPTNEPFDGLTQIRYQHSACPSKIVPESKGRLRILFESPQPAITPGQSAVIFDGGTVLAGGIID
ncbi:MAG: tRNA 2-thiouridine(34) synthase MnmA [candidate division Zixibacteria bacterium]|nr:tRNA 2-thiouridine(34) synthase MnmA [candidate division Zixibacteria bacterium]